MRWLTKHARGLAVQAAVYGTVGATLTPDIFRNVLRMKVHEHKERRRLLAEEKEPHHIVM